MFDSLDADGLLTEVEQSRLDESAVWARRMAAIAPLLWQRTAEAEGVDSDPGYALVTGFARTVAEVGPALNVAPAVAGKLVGHAEALDARLPQIFGLLASGRLDWESTTTIITRTEVVDAAVMRDLDRNLAAKLAGWQSWSRSRLVNTIDKAVREVDAHAVTERRVKADTDRRFGFTTLPNGMARPYGSVPAPVAVVVDARLNEMAAGVCAQDPRTLEQRRVDALNTVGLGSFTLACACERPDCPVQVTEAADAARVVINVVAGADTLTGHSDDPGYLDGYGVIDAEQVRQLADNGALLRPVMSPAATPPSPAATGSGVPELLRHQPSAAVARWVRCRDLTCSFPGCNRSAWRADLDHSTPFDHEHPLRGGWTMPPNLDSKCRQHHRLKTFHNGAGGWRDQQLVDGTIVWTSPTGRIYRCTPDGAELFPEIAAACAPVKPHRSNHRLAKARRTAAIREGLAAKRAANTETLRVNRARAREIEDRKWRNSVRDKLAFFKGRPSTSPWCPWVNNPHEDETITTDWRPPPPPPTTDHDEPPF